MTLPQAPNQRWSLDFVSDTLTDSRKFRMLAVVDDFTRECIVLVADTSLSGARVTRELDTAKAGRRHIIAERLESRFLAVRRKLARIAVRGPPLVQTHLWPSGSRSREQTSSGPTGRNHSPGG